MRKWIPDQFCTGCGACENICPVDALHLIEDEKGFLQPEIDEKTCIECGKCSSVCPVKKQIGQDSPVIPPRLTVPAVYAGHCTDDEIRMASSSGGIFSCLAQAILSEGGCVFGAAFSGDFTGVHHVMIESESELDALRGSKYVQSEIGTIFRTVKEKLREGRSVLFSGLSCQVAGLYAFLEEDACHPLLTTVDMICGGVNSPKAYRSWMRGICEANGGSVVSLRFRDKAQGGWRDSCTTAVFDNGSVYSEPIKTDDYRRLFIEYGAAIRPSCYHCRFREPLRTADLRIADFWGAEPAQNDYAGTSLVFVCSEKGRSLFDRIKGSCDLDEIRLTDAGKGNRSLYAPVEQRECAAYFFDRLNEGVPFHQIVEEIDEKRKESEPSLSVIIPYSDPKESVETLLKRLSTQNCEKIQVLLVDGTEDGAAARMTESNGAPLEKIVYLKQPKADIHTLIAFGLEHSSGEYVHIADAATGFVWKNAYRTALAWMKNNDAEVGCFGWIDADGSNVVRNGFCGMGSGRMLAEYAFCADREADAASYGGKLFNKLFSKTWLCSVFPLKIQFDPDLYEMAFPVFLTQIGDNAQNVLFRSDPIFRRQNGGAAIAGTFDADVFFESAKAFLADAETFRPNIFSDTARSFFQLELQRYSEAVKRGWKNLQDTIGKHLSEYYPEILGGKVLAEALMRMKPEIDEAQKNNRSLEWRLRKQQTESRQEIGVLNYRVKQTRLKLDEERRKNRELTDELQKQRSANRAVQEQLSECRKTMNGKIVRKAIRVQNCVYRLKNRVSKKQGE